MLQGKAGTIASIARTWNQERCLVSNCGQGEQMQEQHSNLVQAAPVGWQSARDAVAVEK